MSPPAPALPLSSGTGDRKDCLCFKFLSLRRKPEVHVLRTSCFGRQNSRSLALANDRRFRDDNAVTISCVIEREWTLPVLLNLMLLVTLYVQKVDRICNLQVYPGSLFTPLDSYNDEDIFYSWLNQDSVRIDKKVQIPQFTLLDWRQKSSLHEYATGTDSVCNSYPCMSYHASRDWSPRLLLF